MILLLSLLACTSGDRDASTPKLNAATVTATVTRTQQACDEEGYVVEPVATITVVSTKEITVSSGILIAPLDTPSIEHSTETRLAIDSTSWELDPKDNLLIDRNSAADEVLVGKSPVQLSLNVRGKCDAVPSGPLVNQIKYFEPAINDYVTIPVIPS